MAAPTMARTGSPTSAIQKPDGTSHASPKAVFFGAHSVRVKKVIVGFCKSLLMAPFTGSKKLCNWIASTQPFAVLQSTAKGMIFGMAAGQFGGMLAGAAIGFGIGTLCGPGAALTGTIIGAGIGFFSGMSTGGSIGAVGNAAWTHHNHMSDQIQTLKDEITRLKTPQDQSTQT